MRSTPTTASAALLIAACAAPLALAQVPPGYYASVDTSSAALLRTTLHAVVDDHTRITYTGGGTDTWDVLEEAQEDPANSGRILDVYRNASYPKAGGGNPDYNREHVWPNSYGFPIDTGSNYPYSDCHALWLSDDDYNALRENKPFRTCSASDDELVTLVNGGQGGGAGIHPGNSNWYGGNNATGRFEVWSGRRGDIARTLLYMDVRYEGGTHGGTGAAEPDLVLTDNGTLIANSQTGSNESVAYMGELSVLLAWHAQDPVDDFERARNDAVFAQQGNRNPFVDHPEWVGVIYQGQSLSPQLSGSVTSIDLGVGGTLDFTLSAGAANAGRLYFLLGSATGTSPGLAFVPPIPLNYDAYMQLTLSSPNATILNSLAFLDGSGGATAHLPVPGGVFTHLAGAHLDHAYVVFDVPGPGTLLAASNPVGLDLVLALPASRLVLNEIDYDQPATDTLEFIEVFNAGGAAEPLAGWDVQLVNGANGAVYATIGLAGAGASLAAGDHLVIGSSALLALLPVGTPSVAFANASDNVQNGAPDAVLLRRNGVVVDAVSYEGLMAGITEGGSSAPTDPGSGSIVRFPDGTDTDVNGADFVLSTSPTPGAANTN
jgi:endonuclease I